MIPSGCKYDPTSKDAFLKDLRLFLLFWFNKCESMMEFVRVLSADDEGTFFTFVEPEEKEKSQVF
jgi:hypothetical protein